MLQRTVQSVALLVPQLESARRFYQEIVGLKVVEEDKIVDDEYDMISRQCITLMMEDPHTVRRFMDVSWVARALERIGDHAKNIGEYIFYLVQGKDLRHATPEEMEREIGQESR